MEYTRIIQSWTHVKDSLHPKKSRGIRQVLDIFTNNNFFDWEIENSELSLFEDFKFADLHVFARNLNNNELGYVLLKTEGKIRISLGDIKYLPPVPDGFKRKCKISDEVFKDLKHLKLAIEYVIPISDNSDVLKENKFYYFSSRYRTALGISDDIQPEFHLKIPKGMDIVDDSAKIYLLPCPKDKSKKHNPSVYPLRLSVTKPKFRKKIVFI